MKRKIVVHTGALLPILNKIKEVIDSKTTLAILGNVKFVVFDNMLLISATDTIITIQAELEITNDGATADSYLLPFKFLYDFMKLVDITVMTIEIHGYTNEDSQAHKAILTTAFDVVEICDLDKVEDFPALPEIPYESGFEINSSFVKYLTAAMDSVSKESLRPAMQKVHLDMYRKRLSIVSTDAHVMYKQDIETDEVHFVKLLIDCKIIKALKGFGQVTISWSATHVALKSGSYLVIGTLQDEQFPDYMSVMPEFDVLEAKFSFSRSDMAKVMEKIKLTKSPAHFYFHREIGTVIIEAIDINYNRKMTERVMCEYSPVIIDKFILDPENFSKLLNQVDYNRLYMRVELANRPMLLRTEGDAGYYGLIMPMGDQ